MRRRCSCVNDDPAEPDPASTGVGIKREAMPLDILTVTVGTSLAFPLLLFRYWPRLRQRPVAPSRVVSTLTEGCVMPSFNDLTSACAEEWRDYLEHDFVRQLGEGRLPEESFRHYLQQDYLFLIHFARSRSCGRPRPVSTPSSIPSSICISATAASGASARMT